MNAAPHRAVVIGGGTGAPVSIRALIASGFETSAVVAMADDGGSSGILRERAGAIPPGDIRKCLVAMAADPLDPLTRAFQYRFDYAQNHALGNLMLTALADCAQSFPEAIDICERLLHTRGHVYPSTVDSVVLRGRTRDGKDIVGQACVSNSDCALERVFLDPADPAPCVRALEALSHADLIVLGPGSLFTSIIPNLLVPGVVEAIRDSKAVTVFVCSIADSQGETWGLNCAEHVEALLDHGMRGLLDVALIHCDTDLSQTPSVVTQQFARVVGEDVTPSMDCMRVHGAVRRLPVDARLIDRIEAQGPKVLTRNFVEAARPTWHAPEVLQKTLIEVCELCHLPLK